MRTTALTKEPMSVLCSKTSSTRGDLTVHEGHTDEKPFEYVRFSLNPSLLVSI